jgi:cell division protein FtsW
MVIIIFVVGVMMVLAGSRLRYFITLGSFGGLGLLGGLFYLAQKTGQGAFRFARIISFLDPWQDAQGDGWQVIQGLYAIGSGGLFGVGLGESKQKYLYISQPQNDFIFAVLAEELGFIGCVVVIALFAILIWRGILIAIKAPDTFGSLVASGITVLIGIQAIMNIAVVTSSMPVTGISLPFLSYGGSSLLILLCSVGILLNISRHTTKL